MIVRESVRRASTASFFPTTPRSRNPVMICGAANATQPKPRFQATPGPETKELTEPYVATSVIARTTPPRLRFAMK
ncbi:unknown [Sutterella sp. CAG:351]|nr:unknown [Sutterella sp. CAG:351]